MRRRLLIARALLHQPRLLLLDEPTVGLDPQVRQELWALIDRMRTRGRLDPDEHPLHRGGRAPLRPGDDHVARQGRGGRRRRTSSSASTRGPRRSRSTARRRACARSSSSPAQRGWSTRRTGTSIAVLHGNGDGDLDGERRIDQPRGRLRPPHRRGDRLMAATAAVRRAAPAGAGCTASSPPRCAA